MLDSIIQLFSRKKIEELKKIIKEKDEQILILKDLIMVDDLTGLYNMKSAKEKIERELHFSERNNTHVAVVMLDIDFFKNVNDFNNHIFGSYVLKEIGKIIKKTMRSTDYAFRFGGDEFMFILSGTTKEGAIAFSDKFREIIKNTTFKMDKCQINVTVSMGLSLSRNGDDHREILLRADEALYSAKKTGRDKVVVN